MKSHRIISHMLTDFVIGDLAEHEVDMVNRHLLMCPLCAEEVDRLRGHVDMVRQTLNPPDLQSNEYWESFTDTVMKRIESAPQPRRSILLRWRSALESVEFRPVRYGTALAGAVALLLIGFNLWKVYYVPAPHMPPAHTEVVTQQHVDQLPVERVGQYFRKSRALLVGLSNLQPERGAPLDISVERERSKELVQESRLLQRQTIDPRSARLMRDIEKIFSELANVDPRQSYQGVELIRDGIQRENLLFKVRMAESLYEQAAYYPASDKRER